MKVEIDNEIDEYTPTSILVLRFLGRNHRAGHDGRWSQDLFQNGIHNHLVGSPYLNSSLGTPGNAFFQFYRNPNP
ncbi:hypothetical protein EI546_14295 [Aequorivita sp. H23M31]|uniref:Uncharacterized protein n=1 Tax=Aequorivita ciconiae TaxID=2494375 RepID=A0A410G6C1_9FLAO|nr:hypothetical protein [Aequorivita sp. H23M31]QAA82813.1 hypothetical protein EI546_14295 [Aequorivita sp. H23M31]